MRTLHVSKSETTANKSQCGAASKAMHGLFLSADLSGCQFLPQKLLPLAVPRSCHVTLYFPVHPPADVWWRGGADGGWEEGL